MTKRLNTSGELDVLYEQSKAKLTDLAALIQVKVHLGSCGIASGANNTLEAFRNEITSRALPGIVVSEAACIGLCNIEPTVTVQVPGSEKTIYYDVKDKKVSRIVQQHLIEGKPVQEWALDADAPRLRLQEIRILKNQDLDPMDIEQYIGRGGYLALAQVLSKMKPEAVIEQVKQSTIRGRGGAGFSTATKWGMVRNSVSPQKYVICNGDEGDPGAYMNRAVLEGNPHSIVEGMAIGAYAIGNVSQGYAYVRAEYPLAIQTLNHAINQARELGLLGKNILGTGFDFDIDIFPGAGAFVCGEETALLISLEGKRGNPHQRPPYPANVGGGLFGQPTTINNVETWSNIPQIILNGAGWFLSAGSDKSRGTKTLCLVGKVNNPGLVEVPLGIPLGKLIFDIGGGIPDGKKFKAVQLGGPSGGVVPSGHLNTPVDYESIAALGAIIGSGGVVVMDESSCMVDVAKFFLQFTLDESCGKCTPCRSGIPQMLAILNKISRGEGTMSDLDTLTDLAQMVSTTSLCGLGQTSPNPILTTLRHFREEYESHIIDKKCASAVCRALFHSPCQHTCPVELEIPGYISLIKEGKFAEAYRLIRQRNPLPSVCGRVCHHPCESRCNRNQIDEAVGIRALKRFAADWALAHNISYTPEIKERKNEKVAIVGAGPAGLSAAWDLALEGYQVTIFEALPVAGGMLAVAIPEYRLPKAGLQKEINEITKIGVEIRLNTRIDDVAELLNQGYRVVFIATGAHRSVRLNIPGEELAGVFDGLEFLKNCNTGHPVQIGRRVAVIGGGNSAIDSARTALRIGAQEVHLYYRREQSDMTALEEEVNAAIAEGVHLHCLTTPVKFTGNGHISCLHMVKMELGDFDLTGRKAARPISGSDYTVEIDTVIEATGLKPNTPFIKNSRIKVADDGAILAEPRTLLTDHPGIFAGGDTVTRPQTVIEAIAHGQRAASSIKRYLTGQPLSPLVERNGYHPVPFSNTPPDEQTSKEMKRNHEAEQPVAGRAVSFNEVSQTFSPEIAIAEASRCLRCDLDAGE
jgi:NADH-quinone oxidoreductase subunit F